LRSERRRTYVERLLDQLRELECIGLASGREVCVATNLAINVPLRFAVLISLVKEG